MSEEIGEIAQEAHEAKREAVDARAEAHDAKREADEAKGDAAEAKAEANAAHDTAEHAEEVAQDAFRVLDDSPDTLIDELRESTHPEQYGHPGRPLRNSPFVVGFTGALGVLAAYLLASTIAQVRSVLLLLVVSMFLAIGLNPAVEKLMSWGLRRGVAVATVAIVFVLMVGAFAAVAVPLVIDQSQAFLHNAPQTLNDLQKNDTIRRLDSNLGLINKARTYLSGDRRGLPLSGGIVGVGRVVLGAVFSTFTVLVLTLYLLASLPSIKRQAYQLAPASRRERVSLLGDEILRRTGGYVGGQFLVALIAGVTITIVLAVQRVPGALVLGVFAGLMSLVPMVGATAAAAVYCLVAFADSPTKGLITLVVAISYQQVENYIVYPRVMRSTVDVPGVLTLVAALVGGALLGVVGALLAIPTAAAILLILREVVIPRQQTA